MLFRSVGSLSAGGGRASDWLPFRQQAAATAVTLTDWLWILHPALMVVLTYPLLGAVLLLARRTRQRRLSDDKAIPASSGSEHRDLGRGLTLVVLATVLLALTVVISTHSAGPFPGGPGRQALLGLVALGEIGRAHV